MGFWGSCLLGMGRRASIRRNPALFDWACHNEGMFRAYRGFQKSILITISVLIGSLAQSENAEAKLHPIKPHFKNTKAGEVIRWCADQNGWGCLNMYLFDESISLDLDSPLSPPLMVDKLHKTLAERGYGVILKVRSEEEKVLIIEPFVKYIFDVRKGLGQWVIPLSSADSRIISRSREGNVTVLQGILSESRMKSPEKSEDRYYRTGLKGLLKFLNSISDQDFIRYFDYVKRRTMELRKI